MIATASRPSLVDVSREAFRAPSIHAATLAAGVLLSAHAVVSRSAK